VSGWSVEKKGIKKHRVKRVGSFSKFLQPLVFKEVIALSTPYEYKAYYKGVTKGCHHWD
jgi:hypothetical protein